MATGAAKRYAQAVLALAKERGTLDAWHADLSRLSELMTDPRSSPFFANPSAPADRKDEILAQVLAEAQPEARNLARLLSERGRLDILPRVFQLFEEGMRADRGIVVAEVTTAEPLGLREQALVRDRLGRMVSKTIELRMKVDPEIIGGIVARVGDQLIDGSVTGHLRRLRERLAAAR